MNPLISLRVAILLVALLLFNVVSGEISLRSTSSGLEEEEEKARELDQRAPTSGDDDGLNHIASPLSALNDNDGPRPWSSLNMSARAAVSSRCGVNFARNGGHKIVGGRPALVGEFPWQVSLQTNKFTKTNFMHYCGATILNGDWLVTASHCVDDFRPEDIQAVAGAYDLRRSSPGLVARTGIRKILMHAGFDNSDNLRNDIALLKVSIPFDLSTGSLLPINSICLPEREREFDGFAAVSGWGKVSEEGQLSDTLRAVNVTMMSDTECRVYYGGHRIDEKMACAGYDNGGKDACQGDSGGPLIKSANGRAVLVGVVSWGIGCARSGHPGVYTQVSKYIDWLEQNMAHN